MITLIGATTENPAFEVNGALLSRLRVYALRALERRGDRSAAAPRRGGRAAEIEVDDEAIEFLAARSEGDARTALNALELAADDRARAREERVTLARAEDALQRRAVLFDKKGDRHYDYISAWIKATRGSDPDASLYYLAVMLEGGEDPRFIVRRMVILASEDIGNADPGALSVATAAAAAVEHVGLPEARYALAQAAIYLALAPKSDAAGRALAGAQRHVREHGAAPCRAGCAQDRGPGSGPAAMTTRTAMPGTSPPSSSHPRAWPASASMSPTRPRRELAQRLERDPQGARARTPR